MKLCMKTVFLIIVSVNSHKILYNGDSCRLSNGEIGVCRLIDSCPSALNLLQNGKRPQNCGFQGFTPIVCCSEKENTPKPSKRIRSPGEMSIKMCQEYEKYAPKKKEEDQIFIVVYGGKPAGRLQFPHMALIGFQDKDANSDIKWGCGGTIISERFVLTAAHCIINRNFGEPKFVMYGVTNIKDEKDRIIAKVLKSIPHPEYKFPVNYRDIGLLQLEKEIQLNPKARPACLYTKSQLDTNRVITTGWGKIGITGPASENLMFVDLNTFEQKECADLYKKTEKVPEGIRGDLMICAGSFIEIKDACQGDSGGPLQIKRNSSKLMYDIIGVVSFGKPCGQATRWPGVYIRVSANIQWIEDIVWPTN